MSELITLTFIIIFIISGCIFGIDKISNSYKWTESWDGKLTSVNVYQGGGNDDSYYVVENFTKISDDKITCAITRGHKFSHESKANHFRDNAPLGITRKIYINKKADHKCFDDSLRKSMINSGLNILIPIYIIIIIFIFICVAVYYNEKKDYNKKCKYSNVKDNEIEMNNVTKV